MARADESARPQLLHRRFGQPRHGAADTTDPLVRRVAHHATVPSLPQFDQRRRQEGQGTGLLGHVGDQCGRELRFHAQPGGPCRQLDRPSQLVGHKRSDDDLAGAEEPGKVALLGAEAVEVGSHRDDDGAAPSRVACERRDGADERGPLDLVVAKGEDFLELVDDEQDARASR